MNNTQITFVTPWYGHFSGGAEVAARSLAEQLVKRGFSVQVLTTCCRSPFDNWWQDTLPAGVENINGVTVRRFPVNKRGEVQYHEVNYRIIHRLEVEESHQRQFVQNSINSDALIDYAIANTQGHLVIGIPYTQGLIYCLLQALAGQASIMPCFHDEPQLQWKTTAEMLIWSKHIFFLSTEEKQLSIKHFGQRLGRRLVESPVVGVGVELPLQIAQILKNPSPASTDIRLKYKLPEQLFVYIGRKDVGKNILTLIHYFKDYCANNGDATLVFLGGGDSSLVPEAPGFLDLGFVSEADKYLITATALGVINLSENESFSIVIMEAWLCNTPIIVNQGCTVTTAHCRKSQGGIPIITSEEFQAALHLLNDKNIRDKLAYQGQQYVKSNYSWDGVIHRLLGEIY